MEIEKYLCVSNGEKIISKENIAEELVGYWKFDQLYPLDSSPKGNHILEPFEAGPEMGGKGYSCYMNGTTSLTIPHIPAYETTDVSISFWLFLIEDSTGEWRTLIQKGNSQQELTPTIMLFPKERRLHARVSTDASINEGLDSKSVIPMKRWTHISMVMSNQVLQLFINGIMDGQTILKGEVKVQYTFKESLISVQ